MNSIRTRKGQEFHPIAIRGTFHRRLKQLGAEHGSHMIDIVDLALAEYLVKRGVEPETLLQEVGSSVSESLR